MNIDDIYLAESTMSFHCMFDIPDARIRVVTDTLSDIQAFVLHYLLHNELIQICIDIHNTLAKKEDRADLYSTFAVLGFERTTTGLSDRVYPHERDGFIYERGQYSARAGYYLCAQKIRQHLSPTTPTLSADVVAKKLQTSDFFVSLSAILQKYFNRTLRISFSEGALVFSFVDTS